MLLTACVVRCALAEAADGNAVHLHPYRERVLHASFHLRVAWSQIQSALGVLQVEDARVTCLAVEILAACGMIP